MQLVCFSSSPPSDFCSRTTCHQEYRNGHMGLPRPPSFKHIIARPQTFRELAFYLSAFYPSDFSLNSCRELSLSIHHVRPMPPHCCWHTKRTIPITTPGITLPPSPQVRASRWLASIPCFDQSHPLWSLPNVFAVGTARSTQIHVKIIIRSSLIRSHVVDSYQWRWVEGHYSPCA